MTVRAEHIKDDRYRVRIYVGMGLDGKPRQATKSFRAKSQREANKLAATHEANLRADLEATIDRRATVNGVIDDWLQLPRATTTAYRNESIVREIRAAFGPARLEKLTTRDVDLWYASLLAGGRSPSTVNHYHRVLSAILKQAEVWGRIKYAPTRTARPPKRPRPNPRPPATDVLARLLADASPSLQVAALLGGRLGLRRGEICGLRWDDINGNELTIERAVVDVPGKGVEVKAPKNEESIRTLHLDESTLAVLEAWHALNPGTRYVLSDPTDGTGQSPRHPGWLSQAWRRLCASHGVKVRFHDLRHWAATAMLGAGIPVKTASARLGHSLTSTTLNMYARALPGSDAEAARVLGELLPTPVTKPLVDGTVILRSKPSESSGGT